MKPLIEHGYVYATTPPLYRVITKKESKYIRDDFDLKEYKKKHPNENIEVQRFKGLGEMDFDELKETTMDPKTRILKRITVEDAQEMAEAFYICMGNDVKIRRKFIEENSNLANTNI